MKNHIRNLLSLCICIGAFQVLQAQDFYNKLYNTYNTYKEESIKTRRFTHDQIMPLITVLKNKPFFEVSRVGTSIKGKSLNLISIGQGSTDVFLWSQMHGDESTATMAIFDIINFFRSDDFKDEKQEMLSNLRIHFLPMLNPDGAELFTRRNALGIDVNRDALRLQSPEGKTLKRVRDSLEADFGFNLHDQSTYYNANRTPKPATISYLAPAFNYEKDINDVRKRAIKLIGYMNNILQQYAPGQVGRYNDDFEPRAFGDNIQKWGTSTVLIESGGYPNDPEKQEIRKLNFVTILSAIYAIANKEYEKVPQEVYFKIPENDRKLFDLKLTGVQYELLEKTYTVDLGINTHEVSAHNPNGYFDRGGIADMGDLSTYYGYRELDASAYHVVPAKVYPKAMHSVGELMENGIKWLLKDGYAYVVVKNIPADMDASSVPVHILAEEKPIQFSLHVGANPTFFLQKDGKLQYLIINGFLVDLEQPEKGFGNALIYK
ncbi:M14 family metallopeptidase [Galbibacter pacificus]|uniref:M14 family metallopeptidase n=1 Tax=Galbibacter pacificus TaxID=2996052 RepID=A0ABT6FM94_9FLAO|nr:M14 metallopeptidase family protein [Galbibacter pacificus]MDG3580911.1 M14 family metallopeptidase [Galbibacter pacificus]MDG3584389.1 M14 family metallopeptidase [Galbibacter pacificus]